MLIFINSHPYPVSVYYGVFFSPTNYDFKLSSTECKGILVILAIIWFLRRETWKEIFELSVSRIKIMKENEIKREEENNGNKYNNSGLTYCQRST